MAPLSESSWHLVHKALTDHLVSALEQIAVAMKFHRGRPDLALLAADNATHSLLAFIAVYAAALGDDCPGGWRLADNVRADILGYLADPAPSAAGHRP